jgi:hypothetical protein
MRCNKPTLTQSPRRRDFDGRRMYAQLAYATPFRGHTAKFAAKQLLTATWRAERLEMLDEDLRGACVD